LSRVVDGQTNGMDPLWVISVIAILIVVAIALREFGRR
jgi:hypothetical protein